MAKPFLTFLFLCLLQLSLYAQTSRYVITLKDKQHNTYNLSQPQSFLSARAIERRQQQQIAIDSTDLPVSKTYTDSILAAGKIRILYTSRWFNQVIIQTNDAAALDKIRSFPFVISINTGTGNRSANNNARTTADPVYGGAAAQVQLHNGEYLHQNGFKGKHMLIAIMDGGRNTCHSGSHRMSVAGLS